MRNNILLSLIILLFLTTNVLGADTLKVFYIPFNVETYIPVSVKDIETRAHYEFETPSNSSLSKNLIKQLKQKRHDTFNDQMIRLKVLNNKNNYYIDSNCNVKVGDHIFKCNTKEIESTLNAMITKYNIHKKNLPAPDSKN